MPADYKDKRRYERVKPKAPLPIQWGKTEDCVLMGKITSISLGGCFILHLEGDVEEQTHINLRLQLKEEHILLCQVKYNLRPHQMTVGCGVEFKMLSDEEMMGLSELIEAIKNNQV